MGHVMFYFQECGVIRRLDCKKVRFFFFWKFGFARCVASEATRLKSSRGRLWKSYQCREIRLPVKLLMALSRCSNNSDVMVTPLKTNFHRYLIQLRWSLVIFPNLCSWRRSLSSNWRDTHRKKPHRAILNITLESRSPCLTYHDLHRRVKLLNLNSSWNRVTNFLLP